ncbi:MAG: hypothetical protein ACK5MY_02420 [Jhaorihella sp.]
MTAYEPGGLNQATKAELEKLDLALAEMEQTEFEDALALLVKQRYDRAARHRVKIGIDDQLTLGAYAYRGEYTPSQLAELEPGTHIYIPITKKKCKAAQDWLFDILSGAIDRPFTLKATPVPEIPPHLEDVATEKLMGYLQQGRIAPEQIGQMAEEARAIALSLVANNTKQASARMADKIEDQLTEGGWRDVLDQVIVDVSHMPAGVVTGPFVERVERVRWIDGRPEIRRDRVFRYARVSPFDFFPAPGAAHVQTGSYVIIRKVMTQDDLAEAKNLPGYMTANIESLLAARPNGDTRWYGQDGSRSAKDHFEGRDGDLPGEPEWHVMHYYGKIPMRLAIEYGVDLPGGWDHQSMVEVEIEACGNHVLRAVTSPYPAGRRPIYATGFMRKSGTVWFDALPWTLRDVQRGANAAMRALVKNMALSAGPVVEADMSRMTDEENLESVIPYRIYKVSTDPMAANVGPVMRFNQMQSTALHLLRVYAEFNLMADDVSGIPAYVAGNPDVAGAGRTLGGLAMLMGNAAKGIKRVVGLADNHLIQPLVEMMYMINMLYLDDMSVKADAQVVARGAAGLLQRELSQSRAIELLNILLQPAVQQQGIITPGQIQTLLRDVASNMGYDPELIGNEAVQSELMSALQTAGIDTGGVGGIASASALQPAVPQLAQLDGRSQPPVDPSSLEVMNA